MKRQLSLLRYVKPHWRSLLGLLATMLVSIGVNLLRPWPIKLVFDDVLGKQRLPHQLWTIFVQLPGSHGKEGLLLWLCIAFVVVLILGSLAQVANNVVGIVFGQRVTYDLAADIFAHVQRLSLLFHTRRPAGDLMARVTGDSYCIQQLVVGVLIPILQSLITLIAMFVVMWRLSPVLTLVSLGVVPFLMLSVRIFGGAMRGRTRQRRDLEGDMMSVVQQTLTAIPAVQAFTREAEEDARFRSTAASTVRAYARATVAQSWFGFAGGLVTALGMAAIMYIGGRLAVEGQVSPGTIVLFLLYLQALYQPLNQLTYTASTYQLAAAEADRVSEVLDTPPDVQESPGARDVALRGRVRYQDVRFGYEPDVEVLKGISLEAEPGQVVAIVGPTGAGKTTLVSALLRFFDPWSGHITIDGYPVQELKLRSLRQQVAIVLQEPFILPFTIAENIAYGRPNATRDEIVAAAVAANADDFIQRLPGGYDSIVGERGTTLSGGEKQRLAIARAFLKDAPILILDEPTSALDARTEAFLLDSLERLMQGRTTLIIAHRLSTIRNADRILVMDHGQIIERGRHADLMTREGLYAALYRQQMEIVRHEPVPDTLETTSGRAE